MESIGFDIVFAFGVATTEDDEEEMSMESSDLDIEEIFSSIESLYSAVGNMFDDVPAEQQELTDEERLELIECPENIFSGYDSECSICIDKFEDDDEKIVTILPCSHFFHKDCIEKWFENKSSCPTCRHEI